MKVFQFIRVRRNVFVIVILALSLIYVSIPGSAGNKNSFSMPEVKNIFLDNGIKIIRINDELPKTEIYVSISYGKLFENMDNAGISEVIANLLLVSGSKKYPDGSIIKLIETAGGEVSVNAGWENISIQISVLSRDAELAFDIISDMLTNPLFDDEAVRNSGRFVYERYIRSLDDPAARAIINAREIMFDGTGYGAVITSGSISSITRKSIMDIWGRYTVGGNIIVSVSSSLDDGKLTALCKKSFSPVRAGERQYYSVDNEKILSQMTEKSRYIYLVPSDMEQATILFAAPAPDINYQGNYAIEVMNYILGGGSFGSRMWNDIREKRGLAYSVYTYVINRYKAGLFFAFAQTRTEEVGNVITLMKNNIRLVCEQPVLKEELNWAVNSISNSYVFTFSKVNQILNNYFIMEYYGLDKDYFNDYTSNISKVTDEQILKESKNIFGRGLITVVVGKQELEGELSKFGKVVIVDLESSSVKKQ